jgi:hypothetical protein
MLFDDLDTKRRIRESQDAYLRRDIASRPKIHVPDPTIWDELAQVFLVFVVIPSAIGFGFYQARTSQSPSNQGGSATIQQPHLKGVK